MPEVGFAVNDDSSPVSTGPSQEGGPLLTRTLIAIHSRCVRAIRAERGATMVEYGLMVALIAVVVAVAVTGLGTRISTLFAGLLP